MAEEALALSPVTESAASPTDADYQAIRDVFMETERGRWFLTEYARRNRNADTAMVLEAVTRIEQNMAAAAQAVAATPPVSEALPSQVQTALEQVRAAIHREFSETGFDPMLLPWRKSARIIREIVWGLREVGADPRICNILDGQVRAIEAACDEFPLADVRDRILAALGAAGPQDREAASAETENAAGTDATAEIGEDTTPAPVQAADLQPGEIELGEIEPEPAAPETVATEAVVMEASAVEAAAPAETAVIEILAAEVPVEFAATEIIVVDVAAVEPAVSETEVVMEAAAPVPPETAALVMASSEDTAPDIAIAAEDIAVPAPAATTPEIQQPAPAVAAAPRSIMTASAAQPVPQPMAEPVASDAPAEIAATSHAQAEPTPESATPVAVESGGSDDLWVDIESEIAPLPPFDPAHEASLGASLIAQGVVARPSKSRPDLLAPIRRMSHAERIAFFS